MARETGRTLGVPAGLVCVCRAARGAETPGCGLTVGWAAHRRGLQTWERPCVAGV